MANIIFSTQYYYIVQRVVPASIEEMRVMMRVINQPKITKSFKWLIFQL